MVGCQAYYLGKVQGWRDQGIYEDPMSPWQWRQLPAHAPWLESEHVENISRDDNGCLQYGDR
jgi:hypothetical protein